MSAVRPAWMRYFPRMERARMQDPNDAIEFGELPVEFVECPYCRRKNGVSFVDHEASAMTYALSFCILCACGWFSLCLLPLVWPVLRTVVHRCPDCRNVLAKKNRVRCPRVQNEVFTMEMSGCAVVLSKKYLILFCVLLLLIFIFLWRGDHHGSHLLLDAPTGGRDLDGETGTWPGYLKFCGYRKSLGNPLRARRKFDEMYAGNRVLWEGRVSKILEGFHIFFWDAPGMIKVDMIPAENSRNADVTLLFNPELEDALADIEEGDAIVFNATILGLGIRGSPHVLQLWKIVAHRRAPALIAQAASHTDQEADGGGPRGSGQLDGGLRRGDPLSLQATPSTFGVSDQDQGHGRGGDASASSSMTGKQSREQPARLGSLDEGRKNAGAAGRGEKSPLSAAAVTGDPQLALTATHSPPLSTKEEGHERPGSRPVWTVNEQQRNEIPGAASSPARQTSNSEALRHGGDGSNDET